MQNQHPEDKAADAITMAFLRQCHKAGRISEKELKEISLGRGGFGYTRPERLIRFDDFVTRIYEETGLPREDVCRCLDSHLRSTRLSVRSVELYLNYPAWNETELADAYQMPVRRVSDALAAVRRAWPGLRFDPSNAGNYGVPALEHMMRIEHYDGSDRLDSSKVEWF